MDATTQEQHAVTDTAKKRGKTEWQKMGYRVPTKAQPTGSEEYRVPNYRTVYRTRYLYSFNQVVPIDPVQAARRSEAAAKGVETRIANMEEAARTCELWIQEGLSNDDIYSLALATHGGNYRGKPGEFIWCFRTARNCIRHNLTNYEHLWSLINRGDTAQGAYDILRHRVDKLVDATYPRYAIDEEYLTREKLDALCAGE
jgi:predicted CoA-binding protein